MSSPFHPPDRPVVAIVYLGSPSSMGGRRRVASLSAIFEAAGATVATVPLLVDHRLSSRDLARPGLSAALRGQSVPEAMAWSRRSALATRRELRPAVVVCSTVRSFHPDLLVIDLAPGGQTSNWQVVREVEDRSGHRDLPVIVFRGDGAFVSEGDVYAHSRATAGLARPVQLEILLPVVSHALERRRDGRNHFPHFSDEPMPESSWGW